MVPHELLYFLSKAAKSSHGNFNREFSFNAPVLKINFGSVYTFTILILSIQEHGIFFYYPICAMIPFQYLEVSVVEIFPFLVK